MKNVFVYGSLMFDEVWGHIVKQHYEKHTAVLPGHKRLSVKGENYPGLVRSVNDTVEGVIYRQVSLQDIKRLDRFEGDYYERVPVTVTDDSGRKFAAEVYLFDERYRKLLSNAPWDPAHFQAHQLHQFMMKYKGFVR